MPWDSSSLNYIMASYFPLSKVVSAMKLRNNFTCQAHKLWELIWIDIKLSSLKINFIWILFARILFGAGLCSVKFINKIMKNSCGKIIRPEMREIHWSEIWFENRRNIFSFVENVYLINVLNFDFLFLSFHLNGNFEDGRTSRTNRRELTENGQTNGADEAYVNKFPMTKTSCSIINFYWRWQREFRSNRWIGKEDPKQILKQSIDLWNFQVLTACDITSLLKQN